MTPTSQTLCLCMIVKNEAHVVRRCLASVRSIVDHWIVVDTGSTDGTQDIVRAAMAGLPGELVERPWRDFAHNRSEALALARPHGSYTLIMDADDELGLTPGFILPALTADSYTIDIHYAGSTYQRPQVVRNALPWRYRGVLHEFLDCAEAATQDHLPIVMRIHHEGARSTDPQTYAKDAAVLEQALAGEADPFLVARYTFYLGQSYRDSGQPARALDAYLRRADLGYWAEEVYVSLLQAGRLMEGLGRDPETVLATYARASAVVPARAEAAHAASRFCRGLDRFAQGRSVAEPALGLPAPAGGLFVETWIYAYGLYDEFAVNAYWCGRYRECLDASLRALESGRVPEAERPRFLANMRFSLDNLPAKPMLLGEASPAVGAVANDVAAMPDGAGRPPGSNRDRSGIIRTIHIVWVGDESRRPDNCIETWRRMNPGWDVVVWGNHELASYAWQNRRHIDEMWSRELCGVADMMRWEILDRHGGFAVDADSVCVRPLEDWLFEPEVFACWENEIARPGLVAVGYVYARPGNALIRRVIADIRALPEVSSRRAWELVGPQRLTDTIRAMGDTDITIYPSHFFIPEHLSGLRHGGTGQVFAEQFWLSTRPALHERLHRMSPDELRERSGRDRSV